jgi:cardiolipin synthase
VRIFLYAPAVLHAKTLVVDGERSIVGSANVDMRSFAFNFELGALIEDPAVALEVERHFLTDLQASEEVSLRGCQSRALHARLRSSLARLLAPLL